MLIAYNVCFFGQEHVEDISYTGEEVFKLIRELTSQNEYVSFLIGHGGEFNSLVSSAIERARSCVSDSDSSHMWVVSYPVMKCSGESSSANRRQSDVLQQCKAVIDDSDTCVFYVPDESGFIWEAMQYAKSIGKTVIEI